MDGAKNASARDAELTRIALSNQAIAPRNRKERIALQLPQPAEPTVVATIVPRGATVQKRPQ